MRTILLERASPWLVPACIILSVTFCLGAAHAQGASAQPRDTLGQIESNFAALRLSSYIAVAVGAAIALVVFVVMRRAYIPFATVAGAACAMILSVAGLAIASAALLGLDAATCASALLEFPARETYDEVCRAAREGAANLFGFVDAFRAAFVSGVAGVAPISSGVVRFLAYLSVPIVALLLYFGGRILALLTPGVIKA